MCDALGKHPQLIAWQIDNNVGAHSTQPSFNEGTRRDWHLWLKAKYDTIDRLNDMMGSRFWGQTVTDFHPRADAADSSRPAQPRADAGLAPVLQRHDCGIRCECSLTCCGN